MSTPEADSLPSRQFHASASSPLAKARRWMRLGLALAAGVGLASSGSNPVAMVVTLFLLAIPFVLLENFFSSRLAADAPQAIVDDQGLSSPLLSGEDKRLAWQDIVAVTLAGPPGGRQLEFELVASPTRSVRRNFWNGSTAARPTLLLTAFDEATQHELLAAIDAHLVDKGRPASLTGAASEEQAFQEGLKALAPVPWLTWTLVVANVLIWLAGLGYGGALSHTPVPTLLAWGGNAASAVQAGEWWRLLTATFLHSGVMHLAMNMIGLIAAGITVERVYGQRLYAIVYLGSALTGSALSLHFSAQHAVSVGASGAVFGVTGALLVAVLQHRDKLPQAFGKQTISSLGIFIAYALLQGFGKSGIDNAAHVGGLLGGCMLAYLLPEKFDLAHYARTARQRAVLAVALVLASVSALAALAPPAAVDMQDRVASIQRFARTMQEFAAATRLLEEEGRTLSELEQDERSRSVHAPAFRRLLNEFEAIHLSPDDPRQPLLQDIRRTTALMLELLEMPSIIAVDTGKPQAADPARVAEIEAELQRIGERVSELRSRRRP